MFKLAYNPTTSPAIVAADGRVIGGQEWGAADTTAEEANDSVTAGRLVWATEPARDGELDAGARAALEDADRRNELAKTPKADLEEQAEAEHLDVDGDESKDELVEKIARGRKRPGQEE